MFASCVRRAFLLIRWLNTHVSITNSRFLIFSVQNINYIHVAYVYPNRARKLCRTPDNLYHDQLKKSLMETAIIRCDTWGFEVAGRLSGPLHLVSEGALYHLRCIHDFTRPTTKSQVTMYGSMIKRNS